MSAKLEIQWSPIQNKFITWGSEVCLYEVESLKENSIQCLKLSNSTCAHLLATNSNHHYIKCVDIYPVSSADLLLAIGQANGRVTLSTFGPSQYDTQGLTGKEFVPRHPRQCNSIAWNMIDTNFIVAGLDKYRSDYSVLLWDIMKYPISNEMNGSNRLANSMAPAVNELSRPVSEFGLSETTHSLTWFNNHSKLLVAGMNLKNIKLIDFRDPNKAVNSNLTKAVFGLCVDPHDDRHLASFIDNQICVWDTRNFEKPILTLSHLKSLLKISWCPTKFNLLGSLQRDSSVINLYNIQHTKVGNEDVEPSVIERVVIPGSPHNITSFCWHEQDENRFLTIALSGTIIDYTFLDRITLNWAPNLNAVWTYGMKTMKCINEKYYIYNTIQDVTQKMKQRVSLGYGLHDDFRKNGELVGDVKMLSNVWNWLHLSSKLVEEDCLRGSTSKHPGVRSVLKVDGNTSKSELLSVSWSDVGNNNCHSSARIYKHEDRDKALNLCGWHFDKDATVLNKYLEQLEREKAYTRAAAIAVFNLKIKLAIDILFRGSEHSTSGPNLNVVAMALAGFSDDKSSLWRQFCASPKVKLNDPYLKAMFLFLTAENYNYDGVLNENGMSVDDRVAFACMYLPDNKLHEYLKRLLDKLTEEGNLDGILLTGNSNEGIKLLQNYLNITGDIQSTTLIAVKAFSGENNFECVKNWITAYRHLLDSWKMWNERAHFDIMLSCHRPAEKTPQQVYVSCNFCGKSISAYMQGLNRGRGPFARMVGTANKLKMSSCPNCRKPLPRCAICLMHMGTTTGCQNGDVESTKVVEFSSWFTWCQSCRHGGHASHMIHWFKEHSECPITACSCRCFSVDAMSNALCA